jgi:ABC-type bacteriocin/lantibiotic exporter with double-glycine peptidase domain
MQRIGDNERIKSFLTGSSLTTLFSFFNFVIFFCLTLRVQCCVFFPRHSC